MTTLIIVRHGETRWNQLGKIQGRTDISLSKKGVEQAKRLAKRLADQPIAAIYTSQLMRAACTADIIKQHHPHASLHKLRSLNEVNFGIFEGLTVKQRERKYPDLLEDRKKDPIHFKPPHGESIEQVQKRVIPVIQKIKEQHPRQTVCIVTHGFLNRIIMGTILEWSPSRMATQQTHNTSVSIVHLRKNNSKLHLFNCVEHLK